MHQGMPSIVIIVAQEFKYFYEGVFGENVNCRHHLAYIRALLVSNRRNMTHNEHIYQPLLINSFPVS